MLYSFMKASIVVENHVNLFTTCVFRQPAADLSKILTGPIISQTMQSMCTTNLDGEATDFDQTWLCAM